MHCADIGARRILPVQMLYSSCFYVTIINFCLSLHGLYATYGNSNGDVGITIFPSKEHDKYSAVLIWLHGLGDSADGWLELMENFNLSKDIKIILPTAHRIYVSWKGGMMMNAWSDVSKNGVEDRVGFESNMARIEAIIDAEVRAGIPPSRIAIGG